METKDREICEEVGFFTLSNAAPSLGKFLKEEITITNPRTSVTDLEELRKKKDELVYIVIRFEPESIGKTYLFMSEKDALVFADFAVSKRFGKKEEGKSEKWDQFHQNAIEEIVEILSGNITGILTVIYGNGVNVETSGLQFAKNGFPDELENKEWITNTFSVYLGTEQKVELIEIAEKSYYQELVKKLKERL